MVTALTISGSQQDLDLYARRLKLAMRGGDKLADNEARALAQIALVTSLDPFIGEIWYIPGKGPMVGIAGARKLENKQSRENGGYSYIDFQPCSPEEAGATGLEIADVVGAYKAVLHDINATTKYQKLFSDTLAMLRDAKVEDIFTAAKEICGPKPAWIGYGYSTKSEQSRMNKQQLARKRAEADALKKRIVVPFGAEVSTEDNSPDYQPQVIEGTTTEVSMTYDTAKQMTIKVQGGEKFMGELTAEQLQYIIDNSQNAKNVEAAQIVLKHDFNMESAS